MHHHCVPLLRAVFFAAATALLIGVPAAMSQTYHYVATGKFTDVGQTIAGIYTPTAPSDIKLGDTFELAFDLNYATSNIYTSPGSVPSGDFESAVSNLTFKLPAGSVGTLPAFDLSAFHQTVLIYDNYFGADQFAVHVNSIFATSGYQSLPSINGYSNQELNIVLYDHSQAAFSNGATLGAALGYSPIDLATLVSRPGATDQYITFNFSNPITRETAYYFGTIETLSASEVSVPEPAAYSVLIGLSALLIGALYTRRSLATMLNRQPRFTNPIEIHGAKTNESSLGA